MESTVPFKLVFCQFLIVWSFVEGYELKLEIDRDVNLWKFRGHYLYTPRVDDLDGIMSTSANQHIVVSDAGRDVDVNGVWLTKHNPGRENKLAISYSLKHALFTQGWIKFLADPQTSLLVKTSNEKVLGKFWSDGSSWCDVVIHFGLQIMILLEVETPNPGNYFILDKIILGIFSNVSQLEGRRLNPCLLSPLYPDILEENKMTAAPTPPTTKPGVVMTTVKCPYPLTAQSSPETRLESTTTSNDPNAMTNHKIHTQGSLATSADKVGERRNTRESQPLISIPQEEESAELPAPIPIPTPTAQTNQLEFETTTTNKIIDTKFSEEKAAAAEAAVEQKLTNETPTQTPTQDSEVGENDSPILMTITTLKPSSPRPRMEAQVRATNPPPSTTLMDNLDLNLDHDLTPPSSHSHGHEWTSNGSDQIFHHCHLLFIIFIPFTINIICARSTS